MLVERQQVKCIHIFLAKQKVYVYLSGKRSASISFKYFHQFNLPKTYTSGAYENNIVLSVVSLFPFACSLRHFITAWRIIMERHLLWILQLLSVPVCFDQILQVIDCMRRHIGLVRIRGAAFHEPKLSWSKLLSGKSATCIIHCAPMWCISV